METTKKKTKKMVEWLKQKMDENKEMEKKMENWNIRSYKPSMKGSLKLIMFEVIHENKGNIHVVKVSKNKHLSERFNSK